MRWSLKDSNCYGLLKLKQKERFTSTTEKRTKQIEQVFCLSDLQAKDAF